ncbi:MAG: Lrp/AsnC family transcriptional regulator [Steroidobacteraceae bacterium]
MKLDSTDKQILDVLQRDAALSASEIAGRLGLSSATCWRRIGQLEKSGVIRRRVALLDPPSVGLNVLIFCHIKLSTQGRDAIRKFDTAVRTLPEVLECYTLLGEWDFLLRIVARDIKSFEAFFLDQLSKLPYVQSVVSSIALTPVKYTTELPLN